MKIDQIALQDYPVFYKTSVDLPLIDRIELIYLLNLRLASSIDLKFQLKQARWNSKGPSFVTLHGLLDQVHEAAANYVDQIAERIVQLGGTAEGTLRLAASRTRLPVYGLGLAEGMSHANAVAKALAIFAEQARVSIHEAADLDDAVTAHLFAEISRGIDQWLWFAEAHNPVTA
jgi:starvation-inducible DNA-binding protein